MLVVAEFLRKSREKSMLTTYTSKHMLEAWQEKRIHMLLPCQNSEPGRGARLALPNLPRSNGGRLRARLRRPGGQKRVERQKPLTVCAAAICTGQIEKDGPKERVVVGIADRMLTAGDAEFESRTPKIYPIPLKQVGKDRFAMAACLSADDSDLGYNLAVQVHQEAKAAGKEPTVKELASLYADKFTTLRRELAERVHLAPFGLTSASFVSQQKKMSAEFVADRSDLLAREVLPVETLIVGVDKDGAHIYHVFDPGHFLCRDRSAFWAIGSGQNQFESEFMPLGYDGSWPLQATILLMYSAKRKAERAPGVGRETDMFLISKRGLAPATPRILSAIEKHHQRFEEKVRASREQTIVEMAKDHEVFGAQPSQDQGAM
jgi:hypothetical protein